MQVSAFSKFKRSKLETKALYYLYFAFGIQMVLCVFASIWHVAEVKNKETAYSPWVDTHTINLIVLFLIRLGNWVLIFT